MPSIHSSLLGKFQALLSVRLFLVFLSAREGITGPVLYFLLRKRSQLSQSERGEKKHNKSQNVQLFHQVRRLHDDSA